jgi:CubicO group peptidase (beta-lactamase class C family)
MKLTRTAKAHIAASIEAHAMSRDRISARTFLRACLGALIALTALDGGAARAQTTKTFVRPKTETKTFVRPATAIDNKFQAILDAFKAREGMTIARAIKHHEVAGVSIALVDGDLPIEHRAWGYEDKGKEIRTTTSTIYHSASITKFVSSLGFATAHVRGDTNLYRSAKRFAELFPNSTIAEWVGKAFKKETADYPKEITIRRMLSHTAGLGQHAVGTFKPQGSCNNLEAFILGKKILAWADPNCPGVEPIHAPGTIFDYSGGGYAVAESMLATATGKSFAAYMNDLLDEWGMANSTFNDASASMRHLADGCSRGKCGSDKVRSSKIKAAGALLSNAADYASLLYLVLNSGRDRDGRRVIDERTLEIVLTPERHIASSMNACGGPNHCEQVTYPTSKGCPAGMLVCPGMRQVECLLGKCRLPITVDATNWDSAWYGQGVFLRHKLHDGLPREAYHDGDATDGISSGFHMRRDKRVGLVVYVNGETKWTSKGDKEPTRGSAFLRDAIIAAYEQAYGF